MGARPIDVLGRVEMDTPLAELFVAHAGTGSSIDRERLESLLQGIVDEARKAWPEVTVSAETFIPYLAVRIAVPAALQALDIEESLATLHATDLYLACACASNDPRAVVLFETHYIGVVESTVARLRMPRWVADETRQALRCSIFLVEEGPQQRSSSIENYWGRGTLRAWVSAAAAHVAFGLVRHPKRQDDVDSSVMRAVRAPGTDVELEYLKRRYTAEFEAALRDVFASLSPRERNVLRCYHTEGIGIDGVGKMYRIHRATAARWVRRITQDFLAESRRRLMTRLDADRSEISSLLRLIQSRIDVAIRAALASPSDVPGS